MKKKEMIEALTDLYSMFAYKARECAEASDERVRSRSVAAAAHMGGKSEAFKFAAEHVGLLLASAEEIRRGQRILNEHVNRPLRVECELLNAINLGTWDQGANEKLIPYGCTINVLGRDPRKAGVVAALKRASGGTKVTGVRQSRYSKSTFCGNCMVAVRDGSWRGFKSVGVFVVEIDVRWREDI